MCQPAKCRLPAHVPTLTRTRCRLPRACAQGFPITISSRVTTTEVGFQVLSGKERLRVKVLPGTAIGWEHGSEMWNAKRDEWIEAVHAAPRCAQVRALAHCHAPSLSPQPPLAPSPSPVRTRTGPLKARGGGGRTLLISLATVVACAGSQVVATEWMGVSLLSPVTEAAAAEAGSPPTMEAGATCVRIDGVEKKPSLNGKHGVVTRAANDTGRVGVRPEGQKDSILLHHSKLTPLPPFETLGVSVPCLRAFAAALGPMLSGLTVSEALNSVRRLHAAIGGARLSLLAHPPP